MVNSKEEMMERGYSQAETPSKVGKDSQFPKSQRKESESWGKWGGLRSKAKQEKF